VSTTYLAYSTYLAEPQPHEGFFFAMNTYSAEKDYTEIVNCKFYLSTISILSDSN